MKFFIHDYAGHPFQVHLSRQLASRGHKVVHAYFGNDPGPKGSLHRRPDDPLGLSFLNISIDQRYDKQMLLSRHFNDVKYGRKVAEAIKHHRPDVVMSGNTPTKSQVGVLAACQAINAGFVYWLQDFYSIAVSKLLHKQIGLPAHAISLYYRSLERRQLRASDAIVIISDDFRPLAAAWGGNARKVHTIPNWAAIADIPLLPKDNAWSREHRLDKDFTFLYSGTLGLKHKPELLISLAQRCGPDASVAVVGQGAGMKPLEAAKADLRLKSLKLFPLQPAERLAEVLASGDVLISMIEADAGTFSVPSKVQSYMCSGRAILLAAPQENLASRVLAAEQAGIVVEPQGQAFLAAAKRLYDDAALRSEQGRNGRAYAERSFDISKIADMFETVLIESASRSRARLAQNRASHRPNVSAAENLRPGLNDLPVDPHSAGLRS